MFSLRDFRLAGLSTLSIGRSRAAANPARALGGAADFVLWIAGGDGRARGQFRRPPIATARPRASALIMFGHHTRASRAPLGSPTTPCRWRTATPPSGRDTGQRRWSPALPIRAYCSVHGSFKFGENPYHLKHRSVGRRRRVEALSMREQVDLFGGQFAQQVKKVRQRAAQPIEAVTTTLRETVRPGPDWRRLTVLAADWP